MVKEIISKSKHTVKYPYFQSATISHSKDLQVPQSLTHLTIEDELEDKTATEFKSEEYKELIFETSSSSSELHLINQDEIINEFRV